MRKITYSMQKSKVYVTLIGNALHMTVGEDFYYAYYPEDIEEADEQLINLMVWILFWGLGESPTETIGGTVIDLPFRTDYKIHDNQRIALGFSGGVDSTAIYSTIKDMIPVLFHLHRDYQPLYGRNQMNVVGETGSLVISTNFEQLPMRYGRKKGFPIGIGYAALIMPLINIYGIRYVTFGTIFDDTGFWYSTPFRYNGRSYPGRLDHIRKIFSSFNIELVFLFAGISEVLTTKMVVGGEYKDVACSCHTENMTGNFCLKCYKCFRKKGILGEQVDLSDTKYRNELFKIFRHKPLKMASSCIYGIQKAKYDIPEFDRFMDIDVSFLDRYNRVMMKRFNTEGSYSFMTKLFAKMGLQHQTGEDFEKINEFVNRINDDNLYMY